MLCLVVVKRTKVLEPEEMSPGAVQASPRPPMPKANQLEPKRARMERWKKNPAEMEKDMAKQRESLARAEKEDAQVCYWCGVCVRACAGGCVCFLFWPLTFQYGMAASAVSSLTALAMSISKAILEGEDRRDDKCIYFVTYVSEHSRGRERKERDKMQHFEVDAYCVENQPPSSRLLRHKNRDLRDGDDTYP